MESLIRISIRNTISISTDYQACEHSSLLTTLWQNEQQWVCKLFNAQLRPLRPEGLQTAIINLCTRHYLIP